MNVFEEVVNVGILVVDDFALSTVGLRALKEDMTSTSKGLNINTDNLREQLDNGFS